MTGAPHVPGEPVIVSSNTLTTAWYGVVITDSLSHRYLALLVA